MIESPFELWEAGAIAIAVIDIVFESYIMGSSWIYHKLSWTYHELIIRDHGVYHKLS